MHACRSTLEDPTLAISGTTVTATSYVEGGALDSDENTTATNLSIDGTSVTVTAGYVEGGALRAYYMGLVNGTITNTTVSAVGDGGGVYGGGVYGYYPGAWDGVVIDGTTVTADSYIDGAGMYVDDHAAMRNLAVTNNTGTVQTEANTEDSVAGIYFAYATQLTNVTIADNSMTVPAAADATPIGGVWTASSPTNPNENFTNLTIAGNSAVGGVNTPIGGVFNKSIVTIKNSIIGGNTAPQCENDATFSSTGHNISSDATCELHQEGDQENVDPLLGPLGDNGANTLTMLPQPGSPAIDTGTADGAPSTDQRGVPRPQGAGYDIGAAEVTGVGNAKIVQSLYRDLVGRYADPAGLAYWTGLLDSGFPVSAIASAIEQSDEYRGYTVNTIYHQYLGRDADGGGLGFWVSVLGSGATYEQVRAAVLASDEYYAGAGGTDAGWVDAVYVDVLHRHADPGGVIYWTGVIGTSGRGAVASAIVGSDEGVRALVGGLYDALLRRPADPGGLAYFAGLLESGARDELVIAILAGSPEHTTYALAH